MALRDKKWLRLQFWNHTESHVCSTDKWGEMSSVLFLLLRWMRSWEPPGYYWRKTMIKSATQNILNCAARSNKMCNLKIRDSALDNYAGFIEETKLCMFKREKHQLFNVIFFFIRICDFYRCTSPLFLWPKRPKHCFSKCWSIIYDAPPVIKPRFFRRHRIQYRKVTLEVTGGKRWRDSVTYKHI